MSDKPEKIEWRKLKASNGDSYYGYFKGLQISYIMDFGKKDEYILSFEDVEEEEKTYHSTVDDAKSRAEELLNNWLIRADLAKPSGIAPSLEKLQKDIGEWSDKTFGQSGRLDGVIAHLKKEVDELADNPIDAMEYADCFMLLIDAARIAGLDADKLKFFCNQKLKVNKKRKWGEPDENGVIEHIKPPPPTRETP